MDYYSILGVSEDASAAEIKRAFRRKAMDHHPDLSSHPGAEDAFKRVLQAYETLKDPSRRSQYDALKNMDFEAPGGGPWGGAGRWSAPGPRPGAANPTMDDWERHFEEWMRRMGNTWGKGETERLRKERGAAERRRRAEAWDREKREAVGVKARSERIKRRAAAAREARHAAVLQRFWQGRPALQWQDAAVGAAFVLLTAGLAVHWKTQLLGRDRTAVQAEQTAAAPAPS